MPAVTMLRRGGPHDVPYMRSLLRHALNWRLIHGQDDLPFARYLMGWGRTGDTSFVAIEGGHRVGAGWFRLFSVASPGYGFVDRRTPELMVVTRPPREETVRILIHTLALEAASQLYTGISVSLEKGDPQLRLYEIEGFAPYLRQGEAITLVRDFTEE